jgi:hypothetical protein
MWWIWDRVDPIIKFAYIHPGSLGWQAELIERMTAAWEELGFDAVHIDQTLVIPNHPGGPVHGVTAPLGALDLHRGLRDALPQVALSGEGLNEITFAYEAFAQRHVWGYNHTENTWDRDWLNRAHPISAYLFTPHTIHYGYLGMASPAYGQAYSAWRHSYRRQNVIPTIARPTLTDLTGDPQGFWRQALDEARAWQQHRLVPDTQGPWPDDLCYAYEGADGVRAQYLDDGGTVLQVQDDTVYRVITGVEAIELLGTVDGWRYYDHNALKGLEPSRWYAYRDTPRDMDDFHVEAAPDDAEVVVNVPPDAFGRVYLGDESTVVLDLADALDEARTGLLIDGEAAAWERGPLGGPAAYGARIDARWDGLHFHPAWKADAEGNQVLGAPGVRYRLTLPEAEEIQFQADGYLAQGAEEGSDGVVYTVSVWPADQPAQAGIETTVTAATHAPTPIDMDLSGMAGETVIIEIVCDDGPNDDPSFDWAVLGHPRVSRWLRGVRTVTVAGELPGALVGEDRLGEYHGRTDISMPFPGAAYFTDAEPTRLDAPTDLMDLPWRLSLRDTGGMDRGPGPYTGVTVHAAEVDGEPMEGLTTHPPDGGVISIQALVTLPDRPCRLVTDVGLRDGSESEGVTFEVWVGGLREASHHMVPGPRHTLEVDLSGRAGETLVLELVVDSEGSHFYDWAHWGQPRLLPIGEDG